MFFKKIILVTLILAICGCGVTDGEGNPVVRTSSTSPPSISYIAPELGAYPGGSLVICGVNLFNCRWVIEDRNCEITSRAIDGSYVEIIVPAETPAGTRTLKGISGWWEVTRDIIILQTQARISIDPALFSCVKK